MTGTKSPTGIHTSCLYSSTPASPLYNIAEVQPQGHLCVSVCSSVRNHSEGGIHVILQQGTYYCKGKGAVQPLTIWRKLCRLKNSVLLLPACFLSMLRAWDLQVWAISHGALCLVYFVANHYFLFLLHVISVLYTKKSFYHHDGKAHSFQILEALIDYC